MCAQDSFIHSRSSQTLAAGTVLLQRSAPSDAVYFIESGRVQLGVVGGNGTMDHQLGVVEGPGWLDATAAVLDLPSAVDAVAETSLTVRRFPLAAFRASLCVCITVENSVLQDVARAHRQQTELAVSRLAKDAEARCAEWLLRHAESSDKGVCSVRLMQRKRLIAAQLGIAPETLSRVFRHLRERSLISGSGRVVNLDDPSGLRLLAGV
jgi:CRP-like cAMP-binding protein